MMRRLVPAAALAMLIAWPASAPGQTAPAPPRRVAAQTLFDEAKALAMESRWGEVCPKLEESQQLEPNMVTVYRLADCYEHVGRTASAWTLFVDAASQARAAHEGAKEKVAEGRAAALEPKLSRLMVVVADTPKIQVTRDGAPMGKSMWGIRVPVDPGTHTVRAIAPGRKSFATTTDVAGDGAVVTVSIPALEEEPMPEPLHYIPADLLSDTRGVETPTRKPPPPEVSSGGSSLRTVGGITFLGGLGAMGAGAILMATNDSSDPCPFTKCGLPAVILFTGAVAATLGGVLWLEGGSTATKPTRAVAVSVSPTGVGLRGNF